MSMRYIVVACLAMLAACTTAHDIYFPDGTRGHRVSCDTCVTVPADCYQKAGEICGANGYTIVNMPGGTTSSYSYGYSSTRDLFIKCNSTDAPR
ncbi:MAG TPA: hypothetical protein VMS22_09085 [Candidatus Eisenbacteria bacterium]|nr:hypothetical protein [Candidatus Eisenbacteria bacterium]